jgi:hypothetical protein
MAATSKAKRNLCDIEARRRAHSHLNAPVALLDEDDRGIGFLGSEKETDQPGVAVALIADPPSHLQRHAGPDDPILGPQTSKGRRPQVHDDHRTTIEAMLGDVRKGGTGFHQAQGCLHNPRCDVIRAESSGVSDDADE